MYGVPEVQVLLDGREGPQVESIEVALDRTAPISRASVVLDREWGGSVDEGQQIAVAMGYRGEDLVRVFDGKIRLLEPSATRRITALDRMRDLAHATVRQAFRNVTLQDVISWCLERAGVSNYTLSAHKTDRRHHFVVPNKSVLDVFQMARETWDVAGWDYYADAEGTIWFMPWNESPRGQSNPVLYLEYGVNLTRLEPRNEGAGLAETFLVPWLSHSHRIRIRDDRLWGADVIVRCERVVHSVHFRKGGRTRIEWTLL